MDLGRHWADGGRGNQLETAAAGLGITVDERQQHVGSIYLWPEHVQAFDVFKQCGTQWRIIAGFAGAFYQGLDYTAVCSVMTAKKIQDQDNCLWQIQGIERGALGALNA